MTLCKVSHTTFGRSAVCSVAERDHCSNAEIDHCLFELDRYRSRNGINVRSQNRTVAVSFNGNVWSGLMECYGTYGSVLWKLNNKTAEHKCRVCQHGCMYI